MKFTEQSYAEYTFWNGTVLVGQPCSPHATCGEHNAKKIKNTEANRYDKLIYRKPAGACCAAPSAAPAA